MNDKPKYYAKVNGKYVCVVCGLVHESPTARHDARNCCSDRKPWYGTVYDQADRVAEDYANQGNKPRRGKKTFKFPGEGTQYRDTNGHYFRGQADMGKDRHGHPHMKDTAKSRKHVESNYHKAQDALQRALDREELALTKLLAGIDLTPQLKPKKRRSALQRMSYAYHIGDWDGVKSAALQLAQEYAYARLKLFTRALVDILLLESDKKIPFSESPEVSLELKLKDLIQ